MLGLSVLPFASLPVWCWPLEERGFVLFISPLRGSLTVMGTLRKLGADVGVCCFLVGSQQLASANWPC